MKTIKSTHLNWCLMLTLVCTNASLAAPSKTPPAKAPTTQAVEQKTTVPIVDRKFMEDAAKTNLLEIELGKLAKENGSSDTVKSFAERMIKDHTDAQSSLQNVAQAVGVTLPSEIDAQGKKEISRLSGLSGAAFDKAYMAFNLKAHRTTASKMQSKEKTIKTAELKDWDKKTLITVKEHVKLAEQGNQTIAASHKTKSATK